MCRRSERAGSRAAPPDGAFYLHADVGHLTRDSLAFCEQLLAETSVAIAPGIDFDAVRGQRFVRLSFALRPAPGAGRRARWPCCGHG